MSVPSWWLSFCDPAKLEGLQFLGACIVTAPTAKEAAPMAWLHGCNPGGEVQMVEVPGHLAPHIGQRWRLRLLNRDDCEELAEHLDRQMTA